MVAGCVLLTTSLGNLTVDLYGDHCPRTCANFSALCAGGFYDNTLVRTVRRGVLVEFGDRSLDGGIGISFAHLVARAVKGISIESQLRDLGESGCPFGSQALIPGEPGKAGISIASRKYLIVMRGGTDAFDAEGCVGSLFYITLRDGAMAHLDAVDTVIGEVAEGAEVLDAMSIVPVDRQGRPLQLLRIQRADVIAGRFADAHRSTTVSPPSTDQDPLSDDTVAFFASARDGRHIPLPARFLEGRVAEDDDELRKAMDTATGDDATARAVAESLAAEKSAVAAREEVLRLVMGEGSSGAAGGPGPSPSTLFVCRLNPSTTSQDLGIIFKRFGKIVSCEVRRDPKTGESLGYGFVEYENIRDAEEAYMKMDSVIVDDRRIRVDFSQSNGRRSGFGGGGGASNRSSHGGRHIPTQASSSSSSSSSTSHKGSSSSSSASSDVQRELQKRIAEIQRQVGMGNSSNNGNRSNNETGSESTGKTVTESHPSQSSQSNRNEPSGGEKTDPKTDPGTGEIAKGKEKERGEDRSRSGSRSSSVSRSGSRSRHRRKRKRSSRRGSDGNDNDDEKRRHRHRHHRHHRHGHGHGHGHRRHHRRRSRSRSRS